jgi:hypothetical protein
MSCGLAELLELRYSKRVRREMAAAFSGKRTTTVIAAPDARQRSESVVFQYSNRKSGSSNGVHMNMMQSRPRPDERS